MGVNTCWHLRNPLVLPPHCTRGKTETKRREGTCPGSRGREKQASDQDFFHDRYASQFALWSPRHEVASAGHAGSWEQGEALESGRYLSLIISNKLRPLQRPWQVLEPLSNSRHVQLPPAKPKVAEMISPPPPDVGLPSYVSWRHSPEEGQTCGHDSNLIAFLPRPVPPSSASSGPIAPPCPPPHAHPPATHTGNL